MADPPDPQELASRYLDLWQQHLTQAATDPDIAAAMERFWQNLSGAVVPGISGWPTITTNAGESNDEPKGSEATSSFTSGATPNPASPSVGSHDLGQLLDRMALLEKRLDALESKPRGNGKRVAKGLGKRRP